ncbi:MULTISPECIES: terpene synthase family protein [unclassified Nocardia]|uniref:terpene synthase family protein n=1 Tax=unclassified Nocardia TaxID=2637762 RepID=UPI001CE3EF55|nr:MULTISPECIES: terpene synthase family protein [unclassified Nocardia]
MSTRHETIRADRSFRMPEPICRTTARINPSYPTIYEDNATWVRRFLPLDDSTAMSCLFERRYPMFDAMVYPAGLPDRVTHSSCMTSLMFEVEDLAVLQHAAFGEIAADRTADHPYGPAFTDIWKTLRDNMSQPVFRRYRQGWQDCFRGILAENDYTARDALPTFDIYLDIRQLSFAYRAQLACGEYVHALDLSALIGTDPDLERAERAAMLHSLFVNDLLSFRKEYTDGELFNVVAVLIHSHDQPLQTALDITGELIRTADAELAAACATLRRRYPLLPQLQLYLAMMNSMCAGNLRWSLETTRYHGTGFGWNGLRHGTVALDPDRTILEPVAPNDHVRTTISVPSLRDAPETARLP